MRVTEVAAPIGHTEAQVLAASRGVIEGAKEGKRRRTSCCHFGV